MSAIDSVHEHYEVREWVESKQTVERTLRGRAETPLVKAAVGVLIKNPFAGKWQEDLSALTEPSAALGTVLGERAVSLLGAAAVEGYGKGGMCGSLGEQEHVVACVTTVFGNAFRDAIGGGEAWISSNTKVAGVGAVLDIPLAYKDEVYVRSHYDTVSLWIPDGPRPDELLISVGVSSRSRLDARVGGLTVAEVRQRADEGS